MILAAILAVVHPYSAAFAGDAPPWMRSQVSAPTPEHDPKANAVILYSEDIVAVQPDGRIKALERVVFRILRPEGRDRGFVLANFNLRSKTPKLHGWSIPSTGTPFEVKDSEAVESSVIGVSDGELVTDERSRVLHIPAAIPGSIVGYEIEREDNPYVPSDYWMFQGTDPVREAHYTLQLPPGWQYKVSWLNHQAETSTLSSAGQTQWTVRDVKPIRVEADMPPWNSLAGGAVFSFQAPRGGQAAFQNWQEMGAWYTNLTRGRRDASPQVRQKVAELTSGVPTLLGKVAALAKFVQTDVRYVAIEMGIGNLQPHPAADVYGNRYGDCKDKVTLLSSMLKEIGVESFYVIINTQRGAVSPSSPPGFEFNHMIMAIQLPPGLDDPTLLAVVTHPKLGRMLYFDPTDHLTPLGRISGALQSNYGALIGPDGGELLKLPQLPSDSNTIQRSAKMTLDANGTLRGDVIEVWTGDPAAMQRYYIQSAPHDTDQIKPVEEVAARSFATFEISKAAVANARINDKPFEWRYSLEAENYAQTAGDLVLVRPRLLGSKSSGLLETKEPREHEIEFEGPERDVDTFDIELPAAYDVDELPPPVNADYGFVAYHSKSETVGHAIRYSRTFEVREVSVPVGKAEDLKEFYRIISDDERRQAVLKPAAAHPPLVAPPGSKPANH